MYTLIPYSMVHISTLTACDWLTEKEEHVYMCSPQPASKRLYCRQLRQMLPGDHMISQHGRGDVPPPGVTESLHTGHCGIYHAASVLCLACPYLRQTGRCGDRLTYPVCFLKLCDSTGYAGVPAGRDRFGGSRRNIK